MHFGINYRGKGRNCCTKEKIAIVIEIKCCAKSFFFLTDFSYAIVKCHLPRQIFSGK